MLLFHVARLSPLLVIGSLSCHQSLGTSNDVPAPTNAMEAHDPIYNYVPLQQRQWSVVVGTVLVIVTLLLLVFAAMLTPADTCPGRLSLMIRRSLHLPSPKQQHGMPPSSPCIDPELQAAIHAAALLPSPSSSPPSPTNMPSNTTTQSTSASGSTLLIHHETSSHVDPILHAKSIKKEK
ncbi:hypothetical protein BC940DRAFT_370027 [Gongronella butleri]|nr:hypothetical protein BC940DRAFT_370027 [Gongronella butleri]